MKNWKMMMASLMLAAGVAGSVSGAVLYYDINPDISIINPATYTYNPLTGTGSSGSSSPGLQITPGDYIFNGAGGWEVSTVPGGEYSGSYLDPLSLSDPINATSTDWSASGTTLGLTIGATEYVGIRYNYGASYGYGWIQVQRVNDNNPNNPNNGLGVILLASSFNTSGDFVVGQTSEGGGGGGGSAVPEPGTAAMLGIGVVMLSAARRRFRSEA